MGGFYAYLRGTLLYMRWFTEYDDFWFGCEWWWLLYWYWWCGTWLFRYALWFIIWACWLWRCPPIHEITQTQTIYYSGSHLICTNKSRQQSLFSPWCIACCGIPGWCKSAWCNIWTPTFPLSGPWVGFFWNDGTNSGASTDSSESTIIFFKFTI